MSHLCLKLARPSAVCSVEESVAGKSLLDTRFEDGNEAMDDADVEHYGVQEMHSEHCENTDAAGEQTEAMKDVHLAHQDMEGG